MCTISHAWKALSVYGCARVRVQRSVLLSIAVPRVQEGTPAGGGKAIENDDQTACWTAAQ